MMAPLHLSQLLKVVPGAQLHGDDVAFTRLSTDTRALQPGDVFLALRGERFDAHNFLADARERGASALVVEVPQPSLALPQLQVPDTLAALGRIAAHNRDAYSGPLVALTGSSGKTTVKTLLAGILEAAAPGAVLVTRGNLNNHIGVPLTLLELSPQHRYAVIEMGASGPGEITGLCALARPGVTLINNVMPAHLQGFGSIEGVAAAKGEIYQALPADGVAVINLDDTFAPRFQREAAQWRQLTFSLDKADADCRAEAVQRAPDGSRFTLVAADGRWPVTLPAAGDHNLRNALAAATCALALGIDGEVIARGLACFAPPPGRLQYKRAFNGALVIDDSYNANPGSVRAAIDVLASRPENGWLVLGDLGELGERAEALHTELGDYARQRGVQRLYTLGELSRRASEAFGDNARHFTDRAQLAELLRRDVAAQAVSDIAILIKGSRSSRMETLVAALTENGEQT